MMRIVSPLFHVRDNHEAAGNGAAHDRESELSFVVFAVRDGQREGISEDGPSLFERHPVLRHVD